MVEEIVCLIQRIYFLFFYYNDEVKQTNERTTENTVMQHSDVPYMHSLRKQTRVMESV